MTCGLVYTSEGDDEGAGELEGAWGVHEQGIHEHVTRGRGLGREVVEVGELDERWS